MSENKCSIDRCDFKKYADYSECILHCSKEKLSKLSNPYFTEPEIFYNDLVTYIIKEVFKTKDEKPQFNEKILRDYLYGTKVNNIQEVDKILREIKIVCTKISFPNTDDYNVPLNQNH